MGNKEELVVKYAILGLKDGIDKDICGYVISKCYVMEEDTIFNNDRDMVYSVFFPYIDFSYERRTLEEDYYDINSPLHVVSKLFDSYDDAVIEKKLNNALLKNKILLNNYFNEDSEDFDINESICNTFKKCDSYEKYILDNTKDMRVSYNNKSLYLKKKSTN